MQHCSISSKQIVSLLVYLMPEAAPLQYQISLHPIYLGAPAGIICFTKPPQQTPTHASHARTHTHTCTQAHILPALNITGTHI